MNKKFRNFAKSLSYSISSNLLTFLISLFSVLVIPKFLGIREYSFWQLYIFYTSYIGFFHFGWNDGIYLRYGGKEYLDLNKELFFSQFLNFVLFQSFFTLLIIVFSFIFSNDQSRLFILICFALNVIIVNPTSMLLFILQATNRIRSYAIINITNRLIYIILVLILIFLGFRDFKSLIIVDLMSKLFALFFAIYLCKEIVIQKINNYKLYINEIKVNINVGIKLMFANIASMLIIGIVRFGIERSWDITTFGKLSLTLSASNMLMIFITSVGIVIFPILRRTNSRNLPEIYHGIRNALSILIYGILLLYYPIKFVLSVWLPDYKESLNFMALLFPIIIFQGTYSLLISTYYKTLRKEKTLLKINLISLIIDLIITLVSTQLFQNLIVAIISIVVVLAIRAVIAEIVLSKFINLNIHNDIMYSLIITSVFILSGWFVNSWFTTLIYGLVYVGYLLLKRKDIIKSYKLLRVYYSN